VKLVVYDLLGKEVVRLVDGDLLPGNYSVRWNGRDASGSQVATGAYIYRLETENFTQTRRMLYLR
jgi:flagellar hook assembly protein FlgD